MTTRLACGLRSTCVGIKDIRPKNQADAIAEYGARHNLTPSLGIGGDRNQTVDSHERHVKQRTSALAAEAPMEGPGTVTHNVGRPCYNHFARQFDGPLWDAAQTDAIGGRFFSPAGRQSQGDDVDLWT